MTAAVQQLWRHISGWPFLSVFHGRNLGAEPPRASNQIPVIFRECEDDCGPLPDELQAKESERSEQFKRDQLLPIMGMVGQPR